MTTKLTVITSILILLISYFAHAKGWKIHASFDEGVIGTQADKGGDGFHGAGGHSVYTNEQTLIGNAAKLQINKGADGWGTWGGYFKFPKKAYHGETIWILIHLFMPNEFEHYAYSAGNRLKFIRVHTATSSGKHIGYNDLYFEKKNMTNPFAYIYESEDMWTRVGTINDSPKKNVWESYALAITLDDTPMDKGGKARTIIWKNDKLLIDIKNRKTLNESTAFADYAYIFTYWNGGSPKDQHLYLDEIIITNIPPKEKDIHGNNYLKNFIN